MHKCEHEDDILGVKEDVREIRQDVKELLKFKWQIFGGVSAITVMITTSIAIIGVFYK